MAAEGWDVEEGRYPGACQRLRFVFGPIVVKPGQNDVLVQPVTIEKPMQDGYITRFDPDLVLASDGSVPPIDQIHLHHATWLSLSEEYGSGPFFAAGEEKTIAPFPRGYGMPIKATDQWQLLYMIHSAVAEPAGRLHHLRRRLRPGRRPPRSSACGPCTRSGSTSGRRATRCSTSSATTAARTATAAGPVRSAPPSTRGARSSPARARRPTAPATTGRSPSRRPVGTHRELPGRNAHRHRRAPAPRRPDQRDRPRPRRRGQTHLHRRGAVLEPRRPDPTGRPTDVVGLLDEGHRAAALGRARRARRRPAQQRHLRHDPPVDLREHGHRRRPARARRRRRQPDRAGRRTRSTPRCLRPVAELRLGRHRRRPADAVRQGHRHPRPPGRERQLRRPAGRHARRRSAGSRTDRVNIAAFLYSPGDLSMLSMGIPTARTGQKVTFTNFDTLADVYHSVTSCAYPCTGPTGTSFPSRNGATSTGAPSTSTPASSATASPASPRPRTSSAGTSTSPATPPGEIVTYYCRIHPFMRGAIEVDRMIRWKRSWADPSEALPVDVLPCSNGEFIPPPPTQQQQTIMALAEHETDRWAPPLRHEPPPLRAHGGGHDHRPVGDRRRRPRPLRALRPGRRHRHDQRLRPRLDRPGGRRRQGHAAQPPGRVRLRRAVPPRRPRRPVAGLNPVIHAFFAAIWPQSSFAHRRPARDPPRRLDPGRWRRRDRPDREPVAVPLPQGAVPRLGHDGHGAVVRAQSPDTDNPLPIAEAAATVDTVNQLAAPAPRRRARSCTRS